MCVCVARCSIPNITVCEPTLYLGRQFRTLPFQAFVKLMNASDFPAAYKVLPQKEQNEDDLSCLIYCSTEPEVCTEAPANCYKP